MSDVKLRFFESDVFECLFQRPGILLHHIAGHHDECSTFGIDGVHETALSLLHGLLNEVVDFVQAIIFLVEYLIYRVGYVLFVFGPVVAQILHTDLFPDVRYASRNRIDDVSYFVGQNKLYVLRVEVFGTLAASSSPINKPSFILMGPRMYSY